LVVPHLSSGFFNAVATVMFIFPTLPLSSSRLFLFLVLILLNVRLAVKTAQNNFSFFSPGPFPPCPATATQWSPLGSPLFSSRCVALATRLSMPCYISKIYCLGFFFPFTRFCASAIGARSRLVVGVETGAHASSCCGISPQATPLPFLILFHS